MSAPFEALPYYKVSTLLAGHYKIDDLAEELGIDRWTALGHWHGMLTTASKFAPDDGSFAKFSPKWVARQCGWEGDPDLLVKALVNVGLCDEVGTHEATQGSTQVGAQSGCPMEIHDWDAWHGDVVESRETVRAQAEGGRRGAHRLHHTGKQVYNPNCDYCNGTLQDTQVGTHGSTQMDRVEESQSRGEEEEVADGDPDL